MFSVGVSIVYMVLRELLSQACLRMGRWLSGVRAMLCMVWRRGKLHRHPRVGMATLSLILLHPTFSSSFAPSSS